MKQLLIIKDHIQEIKKICEEKGISYEVFFPKEKPQRLNIFSDYGEALKDKELETEKRLLEEMDETDEYDEYEQEEWAK